ncbi:MAG: T9SS type A sorting domain-containing protein [Bacteroidetes bacterium]|nr:T9SS type A sorting domain-containing protein [Bacteroidota bacterium]
MQNQNKIEVNGLASGMYIVQLEDNKSISQKIIVQ